MDAIMNSEVKIKQAIFVNGFCLGTHMYFVSIKHLNLKSLFFGNIHHHRNPAGCNVVKPGF